MIQIIKPQQIVLNILGKAQAAPTRRWSRYCLSQPVEEGVLLFHTLTRELLLLTPGEFAAMDSAYLRDHWFLVPEAAEEKELVELVRWVRQTAEKTPTAITGYTILTTTDCNARCFYCYERGCAKITMTPETAEKTAAYIVDHCAGKKVRLNWFGGEPLVNYPAMDIICRSLEAKGVDFESRMVSNAYLLDEKMIPRAAAWRLKQVQITLDGTEQVYNRSKAFIYTRGSAYQVVMGNISGLLDAGISVRIRLNMDLRNAEDLLRLADELAERFGARKGLRVYPHLLFDTDDPEGKRFSPAQWEQQYACLRQLEEALIRHGLFGQGGLRRELPLHHCMANSGNAVVILPDGHIGLCEHYTESEFIGHIDSPMLDREVIESFRQLKKTIPECDGCFYYPECLRPKKCNGEPPCTEPRRRLLLEQTRRGMKNEYLRRKRTEQTTSDSFRPEEC